MAPFQGAHLLVLGHHFFYASLNRKAESTGSYPFAEKSLTKQQFNIPVGIVFAFLVKTFLTIAISTAYVRIFWKSTMSTKQYSTPAELDWANASLANIFNLVNPKLE